MKLWLRMEWMNEFLKWDPRQFDGVKMIQVEKQHLWVSDIYAWEEILYYRIIVLNPLSGREV